MFTLLQSHTVPKPQYVGSHDNFAPVRATRAAHSIQSVGPKLLFHVSMFCEVGRTESVLFMSQDIETLSRCLIPTGQIEGTAPAAPTGAQLSWLPTN